ncbi:MAG: hypothetical protein GPJ54_04320 [Candidatus Heimdallarchaeota archaeon]|nr:hypothetical protein [Candidatus Heimdallarchaeota archaeon]
MLLSRKYVDDCIKTDPTLVGSLISALLVFTKSDDRSTICDESPSGDHHLTEIATTCSRWIINQHKEYVITLLVPNKSRLLKKRKLMSICNKQILEMYQLYRNFETDANEEFELEPPKEDDFIRIIDNIIADLISEYLDVVVKISTDGELEHYDLSI